MITFLCIKRQRNYPLEQSNSVPGIRSARAARRAISAEAGRRTTAAVAGKVASVGGLVVLGTAAVGTKSERERGRRDTDS